MSLSTLEPESTDKHLFDPFIKPLGNVWVITLLCFGSIALGVFISVTENDWTWFGRFGAIVTIAGLLLSNSNVFADGIYLSHGANCTFPIKKKTGKVQWTNKESRRKGRRVFWGIIYAIFGTIIWGFGDLTPSILNIFT